MLANCGGGATSEDCEGCVEDAREECDQGVREDVDDDRWKAMALAKAAPQGGLK